jgi:hypothetical protein
MTHLSLRRTHAQANRRIDPIVIVKEPQITYGSYSQIISYILNMLICVGMILLDNLLQYLLSINYNYISETQYKSFS